MGDIPQKYKELSEEILKSEIENLKISIKIIILLTCAYQIFFTRLFRTVMKGSKPFCQKGREVPRNYIQNIYDANSESMMHEEDYYHHLFC